MNIKRIPKVNNQYNESYDDSIWDSDDWVVLEKLDGTNFRFFAYDSRYSEHYPDLSSWTNSEPSHGDVYIGLKKSIRGKISQPIEEFDGVLHRAVRSLRNIDSDAILNLNDQFDSPLVFFCEYMIQSSLEYNINKHDPVLYGIEVFPQKEWTNYSGNPLKEDFSGFLPYNQMGYCFGYLGLPTAPVVEKGISNRVDTQPPADLEIPESSLRDGKAEGIVYRCDSPPERVKIVSEEFKETNRRVWGHNEKDVSTGSELFLARYITQNRIRKHVHKLSKRGKLPDNKYAAVSVTAELTYLDAWIENTGEIRKLGKKNDAVDTLDTRETFIGVIQQTANVYSKMKSNASLNETPIHEIFASHVEDADSKAIEKTQGKLYPYSYATTLWYHKDIVSKNPEQHICMLLLSDDSLQMLIERDLNGDTTNERIPELIESSLDYVWVENVKMISTCPVGFRPQKLTQNIIDRARNHIIKSS